ncbi:substrate-binding domain-containing protein [Fischerella sp.]|jgi:phosphate transport system substrate-binding protein|uniref:substrate-binding domain-containing protein n=1 Tax=Fischerella sp. TaxID=1191 RepID=UPI0025C166FA|nr:substrate-binding domain-containing protein [Fischerella sp.]
MWQKEKKDNSIVGLALLLTLATTPMAATLVESDSALAQSTEVPTFPLPQTVSSGTTVRIDGSSTMSTINQTLKQRFEQQFSGTTVEVAANGQYTALQALQEGKIDIAAIGRGLTPEEKAQGLEQVRLRREKIAIIVSEDNPFKGNLTNRQFARIFRGEITDWSQVGGTAGKIRVIDRPPTSDIRDSFRSYPAFENVKFATGSTATQLIEDSTAEVVKQLGKDGIGYVLASQISKLEGVRVLKIHQTLPDNPKYPFSQPLVYIYKKNPSPAVASFLGFATNSPGQQAMEEARSAEAEAIATAVKGGESQIATDSNATASPNASVSPFLSSESDATTSQANTASDNSTLAAPAGNNQTAQSQKVGWLVFFFAILAACGSLLWLLRRKRPPQKGETKAAPESDPTLPSPETASPEIPNIGATTQTTSDLTPEVNNTLPSQNLAANLTPTVAASIGSGAAALATGGTLVSKWSEKNPETVATDETKNVQPAVSELNSPSQMRSPFDDANGVDLEAPVAVVKTSYPPLSEINQASSNVQPGVQETTQITSEQLSDKSSATPLSDVAQMKAPTAEMATSDLLTMDFWADIAQEQTPTVQQPNTPQIASKPEDSLREETTEIPKQRSVSAVESDAEMPVADVIAFASEQLDATEIQTPQARTIHEEDTIFQPPNIELPPVVEVTDSTSAQQDATEIQPPQVRTVHEEDTIFQPPNIELPPVVEVTDSTSAQQDATEISPPQAPSIHETNTAPQLPDLEVLPVDEVTDFASHEQQDVTEISPPQTPSIPETDTVSERSPTVSEEALDLEAPVTVVNTSYPPLPDVWEDTTPEPAPTAQQHDIPAVIYDAGTAPELPEISEDLLDMVADAAEPTVNITEVDNTANISQPSEQLTPPADSVTIGSWADIYGIGENNNSNHLQAHNVDEAASIASTAAVESKDVNAENSIVLLPRTPKWAYVYWKVSDAAKKALRQQGGSQFALRMYDVTDIDLSYQTPVLVQQYECEETTNDRYVAIPAGDRNYMAEIGYTTEDSHWLLIARSEIARVFNRPDKDFWFVADAELIIHGATEPGSTVTVGNHSIKLKPDGTFHLRIPFTENLINYVMTAIAADSKQAKTIRMHFSQDTPEKDSNSQ